MVLKRSVGGEWSEFSLEKGRDYLRYRQESFVKLIEPILEKQKLQYERKIERLESKIPKIIVVRELPHEEAKEMIKDFIDKHKEGVETVEIAEKLQLDVEQVLTIITELKEEGKIEKISTGD